METTGLRKRKKKKEQCLNRTMQYGNLTYKEGYEEQTGRFKSYYVVWKQILNIFGNFAHPV